MRHVIGWADYCPRWKQSPNQGIIITKMKSARKKTLWRLSQWFSTCKHIIPSAYATLITADWYDLPILANRE